MGYVLAGLLVLVVIAIGVTLLRLSARRHARESGRAAADESYGGGVPGSDTAIIAPDPDAPLGDTTEHAGEQRESATVGDQDADESGGSGRAVGSGYAGTSGAGEPRGKQDDPRATRPVVGGEGEGHRRI